METVDGRAAFITGGASGIGLGIARALAESGARVVLADVNEEGAVTAATALADAGCQAHAIHLNVVDPQSWDDALHFAQALWGPIHIFCNNAGVGGSPNTPVEKISKDAWNWVRAINLDGVLNGLRTFVPHLKSHGEGGHIVNTGSMAAMVTFPTVGDYCATKYGVAALSETLRQELEGQNIGVSLLCPGVIRTSILENSRRARDFSVGESPDSERYEQNFAAQVDEGMDPSDVGRLVLQAIRENRPYIFTHPVMRPLVETRLQAILADFSWAAHYFEHLGSPEAAIAAEASS